ncbi:MAG: hypothetical protein KC733_06875 [Candidatus Omnitrophica bacterium]|nr:hypothetical protein [Candidatus Omnitrophota bacterium]
MYWIEFIISAVVIVLAGIRLTVYADKLCEQLSLGKVWIGIVLLGIVTSLPEAITCIVSIVSLKANNLAIGNLVGSNNFNPMLLVMMDLFYRKGAITNDIAPNRSHNLSALFAEILSLIVIFEIYYSSRNSLIMIGPISAGSGVILILYFIFMRFLAGVNSTENPVGVVDKALSVDHKNHLIKIWINLVLCALVVVIGAIWLAKSSDVIAEKSGLGRTFVGSTLLAMVTSLPEMVVSLSAMRLGSLDLAIGNIFGSNMTNLFILAICDVVYPAAGVLQTVSSVHAVTLSASVVLMGSIILGMHMRKRKILFMGWDSWLMTAIFLSVTGFLYAVR